MTQDSTVPSWLPVCLLLFVSAFTVRSTIILHWRQHFVHHSPLFAVYAATPTELWGESSCQWTFTAVSLFFYILNNQYKVMLDVHLKSQLLHKDTANRTGLSFMRCIKFNVSSSLIEIQSTALKAALQAMSDQCTSSLICPHGTQRLFCHPNYCSAEL